MQEMYTSEKMRLSCDSQYNAVHIEWIGVVELDDFKSGIEQVLKYTSRSLNINVVINYKKLTHISQEAHQWYISCFLSDEGFDLLHKVNKLAVIRPAGTLQRKTVEHFKELYYGIFPELNYHQFVVPHFANQWMRSSKKLKKHTYRSVKPLIKRALRLKFS